MKVTVDTQPICPYIRFGKNGSGLPPYLNGLEAGCTYTFSSDMSWKLYSGENATGDYTMRVYLVDDTKNPGTYEVDQYWSYDIINGVEQSVRCEFTFTIPINVTKLYLLVKSDITTSSLFAIGDYIEVRNLKLEKGSRATDWTPAPEDYEDEIYNTKTIAEQTADRFSWIVEDGST